MRALPFSASSRWSSLLVLVQHVFLHRQQTNCNNKKTLVTTVLLMLVSYIGQGIHQFIAAIDCDFPANGMLQTLESGARPETHSLVYPPCLSVHLALGFNDRTTLQGKKLGQQVVRYGLTPKGKTHFGFSTRTHTGQFNSSTSGLEP